MIWWIAFAAILGTLAFLKVGIFIHYDGAELLLRLVVGPFKVRLGHKTRGEKTTQGKNSLQRSGDAKKRRRSKGRAWIKSVLQNWNEIFELIGRILSSPVMDELELRISVGGADPEVCAMTYGRVCAVVSALLPVVEKTFSVKKQQIDILCDFEDVETRVEAAASATMRVYELLALGISALKLISKMYSFVKSYNESGADL